MLTTKPSSQTPSTLRSEDMNQIVRLMGHSIIPGASLPTQRRKLCSALADLVGADVWVWTHAQTDGRSDGAVYAMMDDGWTNPAQKGRFLACINRPHVAERIVLPMLRTVMLDDTTHATCRRVDIIPDRTYYRSRFRTDCLAHTGLDDLIVTLKRLPQQRLSTLSMHRHAGKRRFSVRERDIVHLVTSELPWLHTHGHDVPAADDTLYLSARLRSVLLLLLSGDGRKQIATQLAISKHTLGDYIKQIHRHYRVSSRNELVAHFSSGQQMLSNPAAHPPAAARDSARSALPQSACTPAFRRRTGRPARTIR